MAGLHFEITGDDTPLRRSLERVKKATRDTTSDMEREGVKMEDMFKRVQNAAAMAAAGFSAKELIKNVTQVRGEFQKLESAFNTLLGSKTKADNLMAQMVKTAATTPFDLQGVANGARQLLAYGIEADKVNGTLIQLGDIAAGLSIPLNDIVYLYGTTMAQGRLYTQDLNQFTGRGIPMIKELAKQFGVAENQVKNLVEDGKVGFPEVKKVIDSLTTNGGMFAGLMDAQSQTISGQISNLEDAIDTMYNEMGQKVEGVISDSISIVATLVENWRDVVKVITPVVTAVGTYKAALLITSAVERQRAAAASSAAAAQVDGINQEIAAIEAEIAKKRELMGIKAPESKNGDAPVDLSPEATAAREQLTAQQAINAELDAELHKRVTIAEEQLTSARESLDLADQEHTEAQAALSAAIERKQAADERVDAAREYIDMMQEADSFDDDESAAAWAELNAAAREQAAAATELQTATEAANTAETRLNAAVTAEQTATTNLHTAATARDTAAQTAATATTARLTMAERMQLVTTKAHTLATRVATGAQFLFTAAINSVKGAFNALKVAIASNPIGLLITAVTTLISLFFTFSDSVDEATESENRFGEAASKSISNVNTLYAVMKSASKGSNTYKDAVKQLTDICKEYGITIREEGNLIDQLNEKKKELIYLIQKEGAERMHANNLSDIQKRYEEEVTQVKKDIAEEIGSDNDDTDKAVAGMIAQSIEAQMQRLGALKKRMNELKEASKQTAVGSPERNKMVKESTELYNEYNHVIAETTKRTIYLANKEGIKTKSASEIAQATRNYADSMIAQHVACEKAVEAENKNHDVNLKLINSESGLSNEQKRTAENAHLAALSVDNLANAIGDLVKEYGVNILTFKLKMEDEGVPTWMKGQLGIGNGKATQKGLNTAKNRAAWWASLLKENNEQGRSGRKVGTKWMSNQAIAENAAHYAAASQIAQDEIDKQNAAKAEKPKKAKGSKGKSAAEIQAEKDKKIADETRKWNDEEAKRKADYMIQSEQTVIDLMADGTEKRLAQIRLNHRKELEELDAEAEEIKRRRAEHAKNIFEADPANTNKDFYATEQYKQAYRLSEQDTAYIEAKRQSANATFTKDLNDELKVSEQAMRDYLMRYGSYQEKRLSIAKDYAAKIARAETDGERMSLEEERKKALSDLDNEQMKNAVNWDTVFNDLDRMSVAYLEKLKKRLEIYLKQSRELPIESIKEITTKMREIDDAISTQKGGIENNIPAWKEYRRAIDEARQAALSLAESQLTKGNAVGNLAATRTEIQQELKKQGIQAEGKDIQAANAENLMQGITDTKSLSRLKDMFGKLQKAESEAAKATDKVADAQSDYEEAQDKAELSLKERAAIAADALGFLSDKLEQLASITDMLGLGDTGFGKAVKNGAAALGSGKAAAASFASGDYLGAAMNGISAIKSFGKMLGIGNGSNAKFVAETTERLTKSNEHLKESIDSLKEGIDQAGGGVKAMQAAKEASEYQKQLNKQQMDILKTQMSYHGAHKSNAYYWDLKPKDYKDINDALAKFRKENPDAEVNTNDVHFLEDMYKLTPEQMDYIRKHNIELWDTIISQGKYDKAEYWEAYADLAGESQAIIDKLNESLTQISFSSLRSDFISTLMDMNASVSDFSDDFTKKLMQSVLNAKVADLLDAELETFYKEWAERSKDGLDEQDIKYLNNLYNGIVEKGLSIRDEAAAITGYDIKQSQQKGESKGFAAMSQDTADELNGRFTALQIAGESINLNTAVIADGVTQMLSLAQLAQTSTYRIGTLAIDRNAYLSDIAADTHKMFVQWSNRIERIEQNTNNLSRL